MLSYYSQNEGSGKIDPEVIISSFDTLVAFLPCMKN